MPKICRHSDSICSGLTVENKNKVSAVVTKESAQSLGLSMAELLNELKDPKAKVIIREFQGTSNSILILAIEK